MHFGENQIFMSRDPITVHAIKIGCVFSAACLAPCHMRSRKDSRCRRGSGSMVTAMSRSRKMRVRGSYPHQNRHGDQDATQMKEAANQLERPLCLRSFCSDPSPQKLVKATAVAALLGSSYWDARH
jgi:hypothetical protein